MSDFRDCNNNTALHMNITIEQDLKYIKAGADINAKNNDEKTPLYYAVKCGNLDLVKLLIENGADKPQVGILNNYTDEMNKYLVQAGCPASDDLIKNYGTDEQKANIKVRFYHALRNYILSKMIILMNKMKRVGLYFIMRLLITNWMMLSF
jgi:ankyrin repeat protein